MALKARLEVCFGETPRRYRAGRYGLSRTTALRGKCRRAELVEYCRLGDEFIMPNGALPDADMEDFGLVLQEASARGLPVIADRDGGSTDAVEDVNGLVIDGASHARFQAAMLRLVTDT